MIRQILLKKDETPVAHLQNDELSPGYGSFKKEKPGAEPRVVICYWV